MITDAIPLANDIFWYIFWYKILIDILIPGFWVFGLLLLAGNAFKWVSRNAKNFPG